MKYSAVPLLHENIFRVITVFLSRLNILPLTTKDISTNCSRRNIHTYSRATGKSLLGILIAINTQSVATGRYVAER
jgi:hypothetical protein